MAVIKSTVTSSRNKKNTAFQDRGARTPDSCDDRLVELWDQADMAASIAALERDLAELWRKFRGDAVVAKGSDEHDDEEIAVLGGVRRGSRVRRLGQSTLHPGSPLVVSEQHSSRADFSKAETEEFFWLDETSRD
ncbi:hypothetical protein LTR56_021733 [Elasticomyces elasticus]|nr:hypothetical protein LTR56_021733 [Elasticomyces elasticus]KAK3630635.1 hypothetical protein LTR22_021437 [Elasticomyces elasticus]KAK4909165.1 hypothetical protein LTR49_022064 [Elasticomyces elasticus]KAK5749199.1 hypothetical protein LTS12_020710 [Elasticomyces elasticus]